MKSLVKAIAFTVGAVALNTIANGLLELTHLEPTIKIVGGLVIIAGLFYFKLLAD